MCFSVYVLKTNAECVVFKWNQAQLFDLMLILGVLVAIMLCAWWCSIDWIA